MLWPPWRNGATGTSLPRALEGGPGVHHFNWGTSRAKIFEATTPLTERELRKLCQAREGRGCVMLRWQLVISKLAHTPKGPGHEMAGVPFAEQRESPSRFSPVILTIRPLYRTHLQP